MKPYIAGIDLGGTNIKAGIFDTDYHVIKEISIPTEAAKGPQHVLSRIRDALTILTTDSGVRINSIQCLGIGIPGLLDPQEGLSIFSPNFPDWEQIHIVNELEPFYDFPIYIDNDVRVNLYGEWRLGSGRGYRNLVLLTLGTGLGSGIVNDGKVMYGTSYSAGEIGHMNMYRNGRQCKCGSSGCLGRYVSAVGMVNTFKDKLDNGASSIIQNWVRNEYGSITALMISEAYDLGDPLAIEVMHETGTLLGYGLANVVNLLNPEIIIVGGGMAAAGDRLLNSVRDTVNSRALKLSGSKCRIMQAELGSRAGTVGAALYAHEKFVTTNH
ncbi:ROK family protein [Paenibacillus sp. GCM10012306]|uniref:ROK family protein n=1 Tax=Paenibacillus sp. GCM10012306 TaxID=3317342 RepID=UPI003618BC5C